MFDLNVPYRLAQEMPVDKIPDFVNYFFEDKSRYPKLNTLVNPKTNALWQDEDEDFLVGDSGGILMNIDFFFINTHKFSEVAEYYNVNKQYNPYSVGTVSYRTFWERETKRRRSGMEIPDGKLYFRDVDKYNAATSDIERRMLLHPLRITGDHYNYLNYGRIERTLTKEEAEAFRKAGIIKAKTTLGFPRFWDGDYWNFKIDELIAKNDYHLCKSKARRKGYSFKRASQGANTVNLHPNITILLAAFDIGYLTDPGATAQMLKTNLDWYEEHTYWRRGYLSEGVDSIELGYKKRGEGHKKYGYQSKCISVSCYNNDRAAIGKGAVEIDFEEAGAFPNLQGVLNTTLSTTESGALSRGTIRIYGTGGTKDADWKPFSSVFYNPAANGMLAMENIWDRNARMSICGFFHPQVLNYEPFIDHFGNSDLYTSTLTDYKEKLQKGKDLSISDLVIYLGQRANCPEDAFKHGSENLFTSVELDDHVSLVQHNKEFKYYRDGQIVIRDGIPIFKTNNLLHEEGVTVHPFIEDVPFDPRKDPYGCIREYYPPYKDKEGRIPPDIYYVSYDSIGRDKDKKELSIQNSLNSIHVLTAPNIYIPSDVMVATYAGRPNTMEEADRILLHLCEYYNAKAIAEVDRGTVVANFKRWGKLHRLYRDPTGVIDRNTKTPINPGYGVIIGSGERKEEGLLYLKDWLYTIISSDEDGNVKYIFQYIKDLPTLLELQKYRKDGNFDRISSLITAMFQRIAFRTINKNSKPKEHSQKSIYEEIGLYGFHT